jgi:hypothetical protein
MLSYYKKLQITTVKSFVTCAPVCTLSAKSFVSLVVTISLRLEIQLITSYLILIVHQCVDSLNVLRQPYHQSKFQYCEQTLNEEQCFFKSVYSMMPVIQTDNLLYQTEAGKSRAGSKQKRERETKRNGLIE